MTDNIDQAEQAKMLLRIRDLRGAAMLQALGATGLAHKELLHIVAETSEGSEQAVECEREEREELEETWRTNPALRAMCCRLSTLLVDELTDMGFAIRAPKDREVLIHYDRIRTTPARPAYDVA